VNTWKITTQNLMAAHYRSDHTLISKIEQV